MPELKMTRILAAVDLGPQSEDVLRWARWFAVRFGASVEVVHAMTSSLPPYFTETQVKTIAAGLKRKRGAVGRQVKQLAKKVAGNLPFSVSVHEGHALEVIRAAAQENRPGLLVIGSYGRGRLQRLLLGSVAENVYREVSCPTLVVKSRLPRSGVQRVLCPVNLSEVALRCAAYSKALAERAGADLFLLQAMEESNGDLGTARDRLCQWHRQCEVAYTHVAEIVRRGHPVQETITEAQRNGVDLIVIGAQHHRLLDSLIIGRTTEHIVRLSPISVLVVPGAAPEREEMQAETAAGAGASPAST